VLGVRGIEMWKLIAKEALNDAVIGIQGSCKKAALYKKKNHDFFSFSFGR
jgi:hypothetical protein